MVRDTWKELGGRISPLRSFILLFAGLELENAVVRFDRRCWRRSRWSPWRAGIIYNSKGHDLATDDGGNGRYEEGMIEEKSQGVRFINGKLSLG